jgi:hypothetical protein
MLSVVGDRLTHVGEPHVLEAAAVASWKLPQLGLTLRCLLSLTSKNDGNDDRNTDDPGHSDNDGGIAV